MKEYASNVIYSHGGLRLSLLTPSLLRVEKGNPTDLPTQTVANRNFGPVQADVEPLKNLIAVRTEEAEFLVDYDKGAAVSVTLADGTVVTDFEKGNLLGTARTLDRANGSVKLEKGILSRSGVSVLDDRGSLLLDGDNVLPREKTVDRYYFAYGRDYQRQLRDFFKLTGEVPLIPKYALGNWWSRYRAYTQEEYRSLMQKFIDKKLPVTVATIDMDWHWTDVVERFGKDAKPEKPSTPEEVFYNTVLQGWTGYSWNTELFPDHVELLSWLHEKGFVVTLNIHPSQGIRFFEDCYADMCKAMGVDPESRQPVRFDIADPNFRKAYFEKVHHPLEKEGVDFWWIDWQQGTRTKIPGLDPLWALNHYHTKDSGKNGKRPMILSRYAGLGSHRYPLGFSGDTHCTWKSLDFQPYFTNTASNAGYTWWSHDIGGHMLGIQDDELYLRWLQYGVFSPINRLHSSNSDFMGKEPWKRSWAVETVAEEFLRLRHKLIPYLYTANWKTHTEGTPICEPLYYHWDCEDAYEAKNQYTFGGQLLVCPITQPADKRLNLAYREAWLPEGRWTDIFNGRVYRGGRWLRLYRDMDTIPVLAPAGAIVPMYRNADSNDLSLEQPLEIHLWRGSGHYELYEDDGETFAYQQGKSCVTTFRLEENGEILRLTITPPADSCGLLPEKRQMTLKFRDVAAKEICVEVGSEPVTVEVPLVPVQQEPKEELRSAILTRVQGDNVWKSRNFKTKLPRFVADALAELDAMEY